MKKIIYQSAWVVVFLFVLQDGKTQPSQNTANQEDKVYHLNYWISGGLVLTGAITSQIGLSRVNGKDGIEEDYLPTIVAKGIGKFDQWSLRQNTDKMREAAETSDKIFLGGIAMPLVLFLDKKIRKRWYDIGLMYAEAQMLNSNFYSWSPAGPTFVERYRPAVYYENLPLEERNYGRLRNSFYSGHTATVAVGTFFTAKVYSDYHPELGAKKYILYGIALVPATLVGIYRIKALRHFPSDVVIGGIVGAGIGILIPELHRKWQNKISVSATYNTQVKGAGFVYRF